MSGLPSASRNGSFRSGLTQQRAPRLRGWNLAAL